MRKNLVVQYIQFLKRWLCDLQSNVIVEKNLTHSVDECQLQSLQFSVHFIDSLSIPLRCNGFPRIQKAVVDQKGSRPPNSDHDLLGASLPLRSALELLLGLTTDLVIVDHCIKSTFHHQSQSD